MVRLYCSFAPYIIMNRATAFNPTEIKFYRILIFYNHRSSQPWTVLFCHLNYSKHLSAADHKHYWDSYKYMQSNMSVLACH